MTGDAAKVPIARAVGIIAAWVGLAAFNVFALLAFGGWVGAADGFIPWSIAAALLWRFSYRRLGLSPLRATWPGRLILVFWLTLVALAAAGIDERSWAPWPSAVVWVYLVLPVAPAVLLTGVFVSRTLRNGRRLTSA